METIHGLLVLVIFGITIYSLISYTFRRNSNKRAFRRLKKNGRVLRRLSPEEREALIPILHMAGFKKPLELLSEDVYELSGQFARHGLESQNGKTLHDTIGEVDVILPYDAQTFLTEDNRAEVVLTPKQGIVVSLNRAFDLDGGQKREAEAKQKERQWDQGAASAFAEDGDSADPESERTQVQLRGQRDETADELAWRESPGVGLLPALLLGVGVAAALVASETGSDRTQLIAGALSLAFVLLGALRFWHQRRPGSPQSVNQAKGYINTISLANPNNPELSKTQRFLGIKLALEVPAHWTSLINKLPDQALDVDIRVEDRMAVKIGSWLSIGEEQRLFPAVYWGRHFMIALVALMAGIFVFNRMPDPQIDLRLSRHLIHPPKIISLHDGQEDRAAQLKTGDLVRIKGRVRCQLPRYIITSQLPAPECSQVRWGGTLPTLESLTVDEQLQPFVDKSAFKYHRNYLISLLMQNRLNAYDAGSSANAWGARDQVVILDQMPDLVLGIEQLCSADTAASDNTRKRCESLKRRLISQVIPMKKERFKSWDDLLDKSRNGSLKKEGRDQGAVFLSVLGSMANQAREIAEEPIYAEVRQKLEAASKEIHGGVLLNLSSQTRDKLNFAGSGKGLQARWKAYQEMIMPKGQRLLELNGMVMDKTVDEYGTPILSINENYSSKWDVAASIRVAALGLLIVVFVVHTGLLVLNFKRKADRNRRVAAYNRSQLS